MTHLKMNAFEKDDIITKLNKIYLNSKNLNKTDIKAIIRVMDIVLNKIENK